MRRKHADPYQVGDIVLFKDEESTEDEGFGHGITKGQIIDFTLYSRPDIRVFTVVIKQGKEAEVREDQILKILKRL